MRVIVTGGHLSPALAVIEMFPKNTEVLIIGRKYSFEGDTNVSFEHTTAKARNIPFRTITTGRLQRTFTRYTIPSLIKFPLGFFQALGIVRDFKPDLILSFGSYVSLPVIVAAFFLGVPIVIHEQTLGAGLANRISAFFAKKICISWESSRQFFPKDKVVLTGNPIRNFQFSIFNFQLPKDKLPLVYITGGSAGSHTINVLIEGCIQKLLGKYVVIHQTGDAKQYKDFDRLTLLKKRLSKYLKDRYFLTKFLPPQDVGGILQQADIVVSRAGINTVTELLSFGKPALFIPLNNEQMKNAMFAKSCGFAEVEDQDKLTSDRLYYLIEAMIQEKEKYTKEKGDIKKNAAQKIIEIIKNIVKEA